MTTSQPTARARRRAVHRAAVLGNPLDHSLSPVLHTAAYRALGLAQLGWQYTKVRVGEQDLPAFLDALDDTWVGLSLTMPLKKTIQPYGTNQDRWSHALRVTNTAVLRWDDGEHHIDLYNTDVDGIVRAFQHAASSEHPLGAQRMLILGNGNTAASALAAGIELGVADVAVVARHPSKSTSLIELGQRYGVRVTSIELTDDAPLLGVIEQADLIVNTIPGSGSQHVADLVDASGMVTHAMLLDVIYSADHSTLRTAITRAHGTFIDGREMLLYQAMRQVELMSGRHALYQNSASTLCANEATLEQAMRGALYEETRS